MVNMYKQSNSHLVAMFPMMTPNGLNLIFIFSQSI